MNDDTSPAARAATTWDVSAAAGSDPSAAVYGACSPAMLTDLYELTMAAAYHEAGLNHQATFELSVRELPPNRRFLLAAGVDEALAGLEAFRFTDRDLSYLDGLGQMPSAFIETLADLRFTGEVWAVLEGEVVFDGEPLLRVTAPLLEAQLVETFLLNQIASHTMLASKAARVALACGDRSFVDFSARRDHGASAAMAAARAAWIAGSAGTSLTAAGQRWGIPVTGTMAHSFVMSFDDERDAFRAYARAFPTRAVLLIDTYDTVTGARHAIDVVRELADDGAGLAGVRLDSGDLASLSVAVRRLLDDAGLTDTQILASGDLDEYRIADLLAGGAPIDAFGVGTQLGTSADAPSLGAVYKLVSDARGPRMKLAPDKVTLPGRKQVWRCDDGDVVSLEDEDVPGGRPLLLRVMVDGTRLDTPAHTLDAARERARAALEWLPAGLRSLERGRDGPHWSVERSAGLRSLTDAVRAQLHAADGKGQSSMSASPNTGTTTATAT